jgi:hypothetical protein
MEDTLETKSLLLIVLLFLRALAYGDRNVEIVFVDTVYTELALSNTLMYNMTNNTCGYWPNNPSLEISYGRNWNDTYMYEFRAVMTFLVKPVPIGCILYQAELQSYCELYNDGYYGNAWPCYYDIPYPVIVDHIQFSSLAPDVFNLTSLAANVAVLQDSAYIGWVGTDVTGSYLDDIQQARTYTQYRLRFPAGYDVTGYGVDIASYARGAGYPRLILSYTQPVSNSDSVIPIQTELIKQIYPLPAREVLNIKLTEKDIDQVKVSLYDLRGRLIYFEANSPLSNGMVKLDLPACPSGLYILKVEDGLRKQIKKIAIFR